MSVFDNNTRKQTWVVLIAAIVMWMSVGFALMRPNQVTSAVPIADVAVLGTFFATIIGVILPIMTTAYKSYSEKKLNAENGFAVSSGSSDAPVDAPTDTTTTIS
jgi:hypothetical protein